MHKCRRITVSNAAERCWQRQELQGRDTSLEPPRNQQSGVGLALSSSNRSRHMGSLVYVLIAWLTLVQRIEHSHGYQSASLERSRRVVVSTTTTRLRSVLCSASDTESSAGTSVSDGMPPAQSPSVPSEVTTHTPPIDVSPAPRIEKLEGSRSTHVPTLLTHRPQHRFEGLSRFHQSILSRTSERQRFVTGKYPLTVTVAENPTRKWLGLGASSSSSSSSRSSSGTAETEILVNGTSPLRSLASFDRFQWLDDSERDELVGQYNMISLELLAEIHLERPGYVNVLPGDSAGSTAARQRQLAASTASPSSWNLRWKRPTPAAALIRNLLDPIAPSYRDRLWVTGFSLAGRKGLLKSVECNGEDEHWMASVNPRSAASLVWPNEVSSVPSSLFPLVNNTKALDKAWKPPPDALEDAVLVCDGFLVPGKDRGGLVVVKHPGNPQSEWTIRLTSHELAADRWFYHRASWVDLTGDGRLSILTARCRLTTQLGNKEVTSGIHKTGQLVWLECPKPFSIDPDTGTPLESDGTVFHPFSTRHLPWKEHVLSEGPDVMFCVADMDDADDTVEVISSQFFAKRVMVHSIRRGPQPRVSFQRTIDDRCGAAFGCILASLDGGASATAPHHRVVDSGSTVASLLPGDKFSHLLVTSHECSHSNPSTPPDLAAPSNSPADGSVQSVSDGGSLFAYRVPSGKGAWKTKPWLRSVVATGFQVNGQLSNMINPGAPGFVYTFRATNADERSNERPLIAVAGDCAESAYLFRPCHPSDCSASGEDLSAQYKLMVELKCGSTVGSIGIGYNDFGAVAQESGFAKIYIPCYEKDKILVFALGSGNEDGETW